MSDELKAAVERYRNSDGFACSEPSECVGDLLTIAADYLRLTDPTPITEQALRDAGFVLNFECSAYREYLNGFVRARFLKVTSEMSWLPHCWDVEPRKLGELNQLLDRVNGGGE